MCFIVLLANLNVSAQTTAPTMKIATDKDVYIKGDSIHWQCDLAGLGRRFNAVTLQLWIENLDNGMRWQYRFPVLNNYSEGAIAVDTSLPSGQYAFNFMLQANFFNIKGHMTMPHSRDTVLNYLAIFKDKESILNTVKVYPTGDFKLSGLLYQDTAMFSFSRTGLKQDDPYITIETNLDSTFKPAIPVVTKFIHIIGPSNKADTNTMASSVSSKDYTFSMMNPKAHELQTVVVNDKRINKSLKEYQEAYVSAGFKSIDDITLDGLSSDEITKAGDIYLYLTMHVPGLTSSLNQETGVTEVRWRNETPAIYLDEFRLPEGTALTIMPADIAMIKVYRPGNGPLTGGGSSKGGAIAVYTKMGKFRGPNTSDPAHHNRFYVRGYSGLSVLWSY
jgi:hypothetical protein